MPTVEEVREALTNVIDPELGLDFVELGLVYDVEIEGEDVYITFTLTSPGCPIGPQVTEQMEEFVSEVPGVSGVYPKMVFSPPWTHPACSASWAAEPMLRRLMVEFGADLSFTYVMGGLARDYTTGYEDREAGIGGSLGVFGGLLVHWLDAADSSEMPIDPRLWTEGPITTTYPACMAVKAAVEQAPGPGSPPEAGGGYPYLRAVREGLLCFRRKLDTTEALVEEARRVGLDTARFRIDLASHATVEAFGSDLEETRDVPEEARRQGKARESAQRGGGERVPFPTAAFVGEDGERRWVFGLEPYGSYRRAAIEAGAEPSGEPPPVPEALRRFGRMATAEVQAVCDLPGPRAAAELWSLATDWRVRPLRVLTGYLWEPA